MCNVLVPSIEFQWAWIHAFWHVQHDTCRRVNLNYCVSNLCALAFYKHILYSACSTKNMKVLKAWLRPGGCLNLWWCTIITLGAARLSMAGLDVWCRQPSGFGWDSWGRHRLVPTFRKHFQHVWEWKWQVHLYCGSVWELWHICKKIHVLHKFTVHQVCLQGHCSLKQIVVLNGKIEINRISIINSRHGFNLCIALSSYWIWAILQINQHYAQFAQRNV